jgi:hypothetical protein
MWRVRIQYPGVEPEMIVVRRNKLLTELFWQCKVISRLYDERKKWLHLSLLCSLTIWKNIGLAEGSRASPTCPSDEGSIKMKLSTGVMALTG